MGEGLLQELRPIFMVSRVIGLAPIPFWSRRHLEGPLSYASLIYSILVILLFAVPLTMGFPYFWRHRMATTSSTSERMNVLISLLWTFVPCFFAAVVMAIYVSRRRRLRDALVELDRIYSMPQPWKAVSVYMTPWYSLALQVILVVAIFSGTTYSHFETYGYDLDRAIFDLYLPLFAFFVTIVLDIQFINLLLVVRRKLLVINRSLARMMMELSSIEGVHSNWAPPSAHHGHWDYTGGPFPCDPSLTGQVKMLADMHFKIHGVAVELSKIYGPSLVVHSATALVELAFQLFNFLVGIHHGADLWLRAITGLFWTCPFITIFVTVLATCEATSEEANFTISLVTEFYYMSEDQGTRKWLCTFSDQLQHTQLHFSACNFFSIDFKLLLSIISAVMTHLVILLQFHLSQNEEG